MSQKTNSFLPDLYLTPKISKIMQRFVFRDFRKAYLLVGSALSDKREVAIRIAVSLNCPLKGCGTCLVCQKIIKGVHPDFFWLSPESNEILIEQVRLLKEVIELAPFEGKVKVILIEEAEKFNLESGNAMLKILEEPPPSVVFILLAEDETMVLPTIRSRTEALRIPDVPLDQRIARLEKQGVSREEASLVLRFRESLEEAVNYLQEPGLRKLRELSLNVLFNLSSLRPFEILERVKVMVELIEEAKGKIKKKQKEELSDWKELFGAKIYYLKWLEKKHKRELRKVELKLVNSIFHDVSLFLRDAMFVLNDSVKPINQDFQREVKILAEFNEDKIEKMLQRVGEFKKLIMSNVDWKLSLELFYLVLKEDLQGEKSIRSLFS